MGDMHILATYTGWKDFGGAMAPASIVQTRGGWPFFEVNVTAAKRILPISRRSRLHLHRLQVVPGGPPPGGGGAAHRR